MRSGWTETSLGDSSDIQMGQSPDGSTYNLEGNGLPFMQGSAEFGEHFPKPEKWCSEPKKVADPGDLLLSVRAPVGDTNFADQRIAVGRGLSVIRGKPGHSITEFLRLSIQLNVTKMISSSGTGMFSSITGQNLRDFSVLLPPLQEQKRIVDLIFSVDSYIDALQQQADSARTARGAVLHEMLSAGGDGWTQIRLNEIADVRDGTHASPRPSIAGYPLITSKNITGNRLSFIDSYLVSKEDFFEINKRSKVDRYDILISMIGTVGQAVLVSEDPIFAIKNVGLIKTGNPEFSIFLLAYLNSVDGQAQILSRTTGSTQKFIGLGNLRTLLVPLPPISERTRIIEFVVSMDDAITCTESAISTSKNLRSGLLSSLLGGEREIPESYDLQIDLVS
jgi:type I restriction enzyme S subunit